MLDRVSVSVVDAAGVAHPSSLLLEEEALTVKEELDELIEQHRARGRGNLVIYLGMRARADLKASLTTRPDMGGGRLDGYLGYSIFASKDPGAVFVVGPEEPIT